MPNARDNAVEFCRKHGCDVIGEAERLFGAIRHVLDSDDFILTIYN
jgi:hypothetical protein